MNYRSMTRRLGLADVLTAGVLSAGAISAQADGMCAPADPAATGGR
jgi:hypothetical protein